MTHPELPYRRTVPGLAGDSVDLPRLVFDAHNAARSAAALLLLAWDERCAAVARARAQASGELGRLDHDPDGDGLLDVVEVWDALELGRRPMLGENLALINARADVDRRAMELWMGSPAHRDNILFPGFYACGVGYTGAGDERHFIAVVFVG